MNSIEEYLRRDAELYPDKVAIIFNDEQVTYRALWQRVEHRATELAGRYRPGQVVVMRAAQSIDFLVSYFALHLIHAVALPLEQDIPQPAMDQVVERYSRFTAPDEVADILFTTGTTGRSKGVMVSHRTIVADGDNLVNALGLTHDLLFVICGPINHIGSLSKVYPVIMMGATLHILEGLKDLGAFFEALSNPHFARVATFLVPASIRILLQLASKQLAAMAPRMDFIETGAAPMPHSDMEALCRLLPSTRLYNTYASTETGIIATHDYSQPGDGYCREGCLGTAMCHSRFFITDEGHVACQGDTLMTGYADDEELTATVMRDNTVFTADNGRIDDKGRLWLMGRDDDVINVGGYKVAPTEVEDAALAFHGVEDCICICDPSPLLGNRLKLLVVKRPEVDFTTRELARHIATRLESYKMPQLYELVDTIRRTFNGKLDRKSYRK